VHDMNVVINHMIEEIYMILDKPYIFFGCSMGGNICYELTKKYKK
jgi:surfactin synthase thioesterase subunit